MHSAPAELSPEIASPPDGPGIHLEPHHGGRPTRRHVWVIVLALLAAAALAVVLVGRRSRTSQKLTATQSINRPEPMLRLKGTTEAVQARALVAPLLEGQQVGSLTIIHLMPAGTRVRKGDLLVEFDRQAQMRDYFDKQAEYGKLVDQVAEEQAKENAARAKDETELKQAEDQLRRAQLEVQKAEIVSRIDAEKNQESLDEAKATYDQLRETFDLKRKAAQAAIQILEIQRDRMQQTMLHAQGNSDLMQIHSPLDGAAGASHPGGIRAQTGRRCPAHDHRRRSGPIL
jgi:HlyD family secretion protein